MKQFVAFDPCSNMDGVSISNISSTFKVSRKSPELIPPSQPTPNELKFLSDLDQRRILRTYIPGIHFYRNIPSMEGKDPVTIIRHAVAEALVFYYPLAGRLRDYDRGKLAVECAGQGVMFTAADADVMLHQFGEPLLPPFLNLKELLHMPTFQGIMDSPLLIIQVTRLSCGGFIMAYCFNHTMCDAAGIKQFMSAVGELARGATVPSILPVWQRHLLAASKPNHEPRSKSGGVGEPRHKSGGVVAPFPLENMVQRSFIFDAADISALRRSLPPHLQNCTRFEAVAACVWRCWTVALSPEPDEYVRFSCTVDIRKRMDPPLPVGYYGNAVVPSFAVTTAEKLSKYPLGYAVELVRKAREGETKESVAAAMTYMVSDLTHLGLEMVDFGWGRAAYGGVAKGVIDGPPGLLTWYIPFEKEGKMVPVCLPPKAMELFIKELQQMTMATSWFNKSAL